VRLAGPDPRAVVAVVEEVRRHALDRGGSVLVRHRPAGVDALVDALGPPPSSAALLRRVREQFDPTGRCAPGRFEPWY
jgi:glycolate oxidase FAD binding subunit